MTTNGKTPKPSAGAPRRPPDAIGRDLEDLATDLDCIAVMADTAQGELVDVGDDSPACSRLWADLKAIEAMVRRARDLANGYAGELGAPIKHSDACRCAWCDEQHKRALAAKHRFDLKEQIAASESEKRTAAAQ